MFTNIGPEQEYFLVDRRLAEQRPDLVLTGRTLFGAAPPKGQELEDQYFGPIRERILAFMMDLDRELWRLGIPSKTRHNEVAPGQFEMAPVYEPTSVGSDHNMVVMATMRRLAPRHGLMFLIHEKPFAGINGSGKHNNWSMATDDGENLLDPGNDPHANAQFLAFLVAVIRAVNVHADLLRASIADAGNDHRLGANEAPPAIMSIFLGSQLEDVVDQLARGAASGSKQGGSVKLGVALAAGAGQGRTRTATGPRRSRSPATSSSSVPSARRRPIYWPQTVLNTAVADSLAKLADDLDKLDAGDFAGLTTILSSIVGANKQVLFEGNGYSEEWHAEAAERGLPNNKSTVDALPALTTAKAKKVFAQVRRPVRARAGLAHRDPLGALRQGLEHRGQLRARHRLDDDPARHRRLPGRAGRGVIVARHRDRQPARIGSGRLAGGCDRGARAAQHHAHEAGSVQAEAKAFVDVGHPGPGRAAGRRRCPRDPGRGRPLAAAEVPRAALPVLSRVGRARGPVTHGREPRPPRRRPPRD